MQRSGRPVLEELEPRILYAADLAALASAGAEMMHDMRLQQEEHSAASASAEIAFVDMTVPDAQALVAGLQAGRESGRPIEIVRIEAGEDGIARISDTLAQRHGIGAVHVLSHGDSGMLQLGSTRLDPQSLLARAPEIAAWGESLTADADLLLYGCDLAADAPGRALIASLAALSGADVAASTDPTGSAARGGDWVLEASTGRIQAGSAVSVATQQAWSGLLGNDILVNTTTNNTQTTEAEARGSQQSVAIDANGNSVIVWSSNGQDGSGMGVYARRFDINGNALSGEIRVAQSTAGDQKHPRVVCDAQGNFVVAWTGADGSGTSVFVRRFAADGSALTGEVRANATTTGGQSNVVLGMNGANGRFVVAWQGEGPGDTAGVFYRRFAADASALDGADRRANTTDAGTEQNPALAVDRSGRFVIAWEQGNHLYFQRFDATGAAQGARAQVDTALSSSAGPSIAMDDAGNFTIAYRGQGIMPGVWARGYHADGSDRYLWLYVSGGDGTSPSIDMAGDGSFILTYQRTGADSAGWATAARKYHADGSANGAEFIVNQYTNGDQRASSVALLDSDNFVVAWSGFGAADNKGVYARIYTQPNSAPAIVSNGGAGTAALSVAENTSAVTTVSATDSDRPAQTITYTIAGGADAACFTIDSATGELRFVAARNFESPADANGDNRYEVTVAASDGALSDTQAITVMLGDINEFAVGVPGDIDASANTVAENAGIGTAVGIRVRATDADGTNSSVTYSLANSAGGRFAIDAVTGVITVAGVLDHETDPTLNLVARATSADGSTSTQVFTVVVSDANEAGIGAIADSNGAANTVAENAAVGSAAGITASASDPDAGDTVTYSLDDNASNRFSINAATGQVVVSGPLNAEAATSHQIVVRAVSSDGSFNLQTFSIAVSDVNEFTIGAITDADPSANELSEDAAAGTRVGIAASAVDADAGNNGISYALTNSAGGRFTVNAGTGVVTLARSVHEEGIASHTIVLRATSADGSMSTRVFTIDILPVNDHAPVIGSDGGFDEARLQVAENTLAVTQVQATDADLPADTLVYSIAGGADAARFTIDPATGTLRFAAAPDREAPADADHDGVYEVAVRAGDGLLFDEQAIRVTVTNVDEAPLLVDNRLVISEGGSAVPLLAASDADSAAGDLVYRVQDVSGGHFERTTAPGRGVLTFTQAEVNAGSVRFVSDGGEAAPAYRVVLGDAGTQLGASAAAVSFTAVNDAPAAPAQDLGAIAEDGHRDITAAELLAGASDAEGQALSVSGLHIASGQGTLVELSPGLWRLAPAADWHGTFTLAYDVFDGQASTAAGATLQVLSVNDAPRLSSHGGAPAAGIDVAENTRRVGSVQATDADTGTRLHYTIAGGADAAHFRIDANTGALVWAAAPDRELARDADADNRYQVIVSASDGERSVQQALTVTVRNVDEAPLVDRHSLLLSNSQVTLVLHASDPDTPASQLAYRVSATGGGHFELAGAPGRVVNAFTQADIDAGRVRFVGDAGGAEPHYTLRLSDGVSELVVQAPTAQRAGTDPAADLQLAPPAAGLPPAARTTPPAASASAAATGPAATPDSEAALPVRDEAGLDVLLGLGGAADRPALQAPADTASHTGPAGVVAHSMAPNLRDIGDASALPGAKPAFEMLPQQDIASLGTRAVTLDLLGSSTGTALAQDLDRLREQLDGDADTLTIAAGSTALLSTGLSVGYVIWLARGGVLVASLMSSLPAWASVDPLPVLAQMRRADGDAEDDDAEADPIEQLFSKARRLLVRPAEAAPARVAALETAEAES